MGVTVEQQGDTEHFASTQMFQCYCSLEVDKCLLISVLHLGYNDPYKKQNITIHDDLENNFH